MKPFKSMQNVPALTLLVAILVLAVSPAGADDTVAETYAANRGNGSRTSADIQDDFKGTGQLGQAAVSVYLNLGDEFTWTNDSTVTETTTVQQVLDYRDLSCFEFVGFVGWMAGNQRTMNSGAPYVGFGKAIFKRNTVNTWDRSSVIPAGKIVAGWARWPVGDWDHNLGNYYHIGISVGNGYMISLRGDGDLVYEKIEDCFPRSGYSEVKFGDYNWKMEQGGVPTRLQAKQQGGGGKGPSSEETSSLKSATDESYVNLEEQTEVTIRSMIGPGYQPIDVDPLGEHEVGPAYHDREWRDDFQLHKPNH